MINEERAKAVWILHKENITVSEISKKLSIDRKTVRKMIKNEGIVLRKVRIDKLVLDDDLIIRTFKKCDGWGERTHEELEKTGIKIAYSTLMKKLKSLKLNETKKPFSTPVADVPGEESQHDLSPYKIDIGGKTMNLQASYLHYRYSKMGYLKFYPSFNRFNM
jgi:transposase